MNSIVEDILMHYGMPRRSGRYPYGSGENPYQHSGDFLSRVQELKKSGMSETDIAKNMGLTTTQLRTQMSLATVGCGSGLNRRELFTDARDISSNVGSDDALTDAEYMAQLQQRGKEKLAENVSITSFEGETETTIMFQYGKDFFNGDIVQIANEYGHETKARILEIVRSEDKDGYSVYPTFKTIEQEGA